MTDKPVDYARLREQWRRHHARFQRYVEAHGLPCQDCGGRGTHGGGSYEPPENCGWCETTGLTTRWLRGLWLRFRREEKRKQAAA
jgi:hypothetical protein